MSTRRLRLLGVWLAAAIVLGGALLGAQIGKNPLGDPDLAYQRPGFLDAHATPFPAPPVTEDVPAPGSRAVVFFTRPELASRLITALTKRPALRDRALIAVVVSGAMPPGDLPGEAFVVDREAGLAGVPVLADSTARLAAAFAMRRPRDGGPPVGYAIVDRSGRGRYRTLDPHMAEQLEEVETMLKATP